MNIFTNKHLIAVCAMVCGLYANSVMAQVTNDSTVVTNDSTVVSDDAPTTNLSTSDQRLDSLTKVVSTLQGQVDQGEKERKLDKIWGRRRFFTFNLLTNQSLTYVDNESMKQKMAFGAGITLGRTAYLHKNPIAGMIKFGIDWSFLDLTYVKFKDEIDYENTSLTSSGYNSGYDDEDDYDDYDEDGGIDLGRQLIEYSLRIGPSVTVNPVHYLKVAAYFHYVPTASLSLINSEAGFAFVNGCAFGMSASWKALTFGFEKRWAKAKYKNFNTDEFDGEVVPDESYDDLEFNVQVPKGDTAKMKNSSFRIFLGFRF